MGYPAMFCGSGERLDQAEIDLRGRLSYNLEFCAVHEQGVS
jgi:hypothetical protein